MSDEEIVVLKTSDQVLTSNTNLFEDTHLRFFIKAEEIWQFQFFLFITTASGSPDIKISITGPSASDVKIYQNVWDDTGTLINAGNIVGYNGITSQDVAVASDTIGQIMGMVSNGTSDGEVRLKWGQRINSADAVTVKRGSYLIARRINISTDFHEFDKIAAGVGVSLMLDKDGNAFSFGSNSSNLGALGHDDNITRSTPVLVVGSHVFSKINIAHAGTFISNSAALKADGSAWGWGPGASGDLGDGTSIDRSSPVSVLGGHSFTDISTSSGNTIGLKSDGSAWSWGRNNEGQIGDSTTSNKSSPISVIGGHSFASIGTGSNMAFGLKASGSLWTWGFNGQGQLGDGTTANRSSPTSVLGQHTFVKADDAGDNVFLNTFMVALKSDGSAWAWGDNSQDQLGNGTTISRSSPVSVSGNHSFTDVVAGGSHVLALKADGSAWAWGFQLNNVLGTGTGSVNSPVSVLGGHEFAVLSTGRAHSIGLRSDNSAWSWGLNSSGQLGISSVTEKTSPVSVVNGP